MPTKNVNLADHQAKFINLSVEQGRYKNASEVVRAGLRLLEQQEAEDRIKLDTLQNIATESFAALDRGDHITVAPDKLDSFFDLMDRNIRPR